MHFSSTDLKAFSDSFLELPYELDLASCRGVELAYEASLTAISEFDIDDPLMSQTISAR